MLQRAFFSKGFIFPMFFDRLFTLGVFERSVENLVTCEEFSKALES